MNRNKQQFIFSGIILILILALTSCEKEEELTDNQKINHIVYDLMENWYLWYEHLPDEDTADYLLDPNSFISSIRYDKYDRWSHLMPETEYKAYFEEGEMAGHGISLGADNDGNIRIYFIYPTTSAYEKGVRRGWIINKVNGIKATAENVIDLLGERSTGLTNNIEFTTNNNENLSLSLTKEIISINPVLHEEVIMRDNIKIGYMVFQDFIDSGTSIIDNTFNKFFTENIDELIIDLRYNGGGNVDVALHISGWIAGNFANNTLINFIHNDMNSRRNREFLIPENSNSLQLERIIFITTGETASASELLINGMTPFKEVVLVGSTTHGKPVGMYPFSMKDYDWVVMPVSFEYTNANNEGGFYDGIPVNIPAADDPTKPFGNPEESCLKTALEYLTSGTVTGMSYKSTKQNELLVDARPLSSFYKAH